LLNNYWGWLLDFLDFLDLLFSLVFFGDGLDRLLDNDWLLDLHRCFLLNHRDCLMEHWRGFDDFFDLDDWGLLDQLNWLFRSEFNLDWSSHLARRLGHLFSDGLDLLHSDLSLKICDLSFELIHLLLW